MALKVKNEEAQRLALELASLTGEALTRAITEAIRERLDRVRVSAAEVSLSVKEPFRSVDHAKLLYNEKGLPR
jgi:antitoxin VapB